MIEILMILNEFENSTIQAPLKYQSLARSFTTKPHLKYSTALAAKVSSFTQHFMLLNNLIREFGVCQFTRKQKTQTGSLLQSSYNNLG